MFLSSVDEVADSALIASLEPKLVQAGWRKPTDLVGALPAEVVESLEGVGPPGRAFVRRSVEEAQARQLEHRRRLQAEAMVQDNAQGAQSIVPAVAPQSLAQQQPELLSQLQGLLGTEQSALAVAQALASNEAKPSVAKLMETAGLDSISDHFCPDEETFVAIVLDGKAAKKAGRKAFTFIELTHTSVLPDWLPPEAVGGKTVVPGEECLQGYTGNLSQLGSAIKALTTAPRCFRNMSQWTAAFLRYAIAAIAAEQLTWPWICMHMQMVVRLSLEESTLIAIIYDDLFRKSLSRRAAKGDPSLDIATSVLVKDLELLERAKAKVKLVTKAAGLQQSTNHGDSAPGLKSVLGDAEAAISKQVAMAQQVQRSAESATQRLQNQKNAQGKQHQHQPSKGGGKNNKRSWQHTQQPKGGGKGGQAPWKKPRWGGR